MTINVPAEHLRNAVGALYQGALIQAVFALTRPGGVGIAEAKDWLEGLSASADPLEAALGAVYLESKALRDATPAEELTEKEDARANAVAELRGVSPPLAPPPAPYDPTKDDALLARGLKHDFPEGSLDLGLALLFYPVEVPQLSLARAAHLCRLSNSLFAMWRGGETDEAGARAIVRSGAPGYSEASYQRAWDNARVVNGG